MSKMLRMPSVDELPPGSRRAFVGELFTYFRAAGRPSPVSIAAAVTQTHGSAPVTVSRETVRRLLKGETTSTWPTVRAVHEVLCRMGDQDPTWRRFSDSNDYDEDNDTRTLREYIRDLWNDAVDGVEPDDEADHPQLAPVPQPSPPAAPTGGWGGGSNPGGWGASHQQPQDDPWATGTPQKKTNSQKTYSDEPPF
ncbi:hypothetical protein OG936_37300 [Streptomyces sp. NBC_00846]|uniref:hypothetical protein n=1 Tax=Streptomyces sp. NBC_00846 TaxID=2975849 RepID=UPI00386ED2BD|nr:hypothetical protein OG936_37300 [Streptomyces sp. NBC_00846]